MRKLFLSLTIVLGLSLLASCNPDQSTEVTNDSSTLALVANGEDFVREGFIAKDGWDISFNHVYVNLANVTAYETDPPFNAETDKEIKAKKQVTLLDTAKTLDLAEGDENAPPILVNKINAEPGFYNALSWSLVRGNEGVTGNHSIILEGVAQKDGKTVNFLVSLNPELSYQCDEFIGETRKGILTEKSTAELEITMHFDHIFGDQQLSLDDELNLGALGFEPLAKLAQNDSLKVTVEELSQKLTADEYQRLTTAINSLGHVGEGHCHEKSG
jgi:hypothetical protein